MGSGVRRTKLVKAPAGPRTGGATGATGAPLDFIGFHAKGRPEVIDGHVRMGISSQLTDIDQGFATVASFP